MWNIVSNLTEGLIQGIFSHAISLMNLQPCPLPAQINAIAEFNIYTYVSTLLYAHSFIISLVFAFFFSFVERKRDPSECVFMSFIHQLWLDNAFSECMSLVY